MALSEQDKQRIAALAGRRKPKPDEDSDRLNLAGSMGAPLPLGTARHRQQQDWLFALRTSGVKILLLGALPLALLVAGGAYARRHDLHRMDFGAVFDSSAGLTMRHRFMRQVELQKKKRALLDEAQALSFASDYIGAVANADQVLALEAENAEAQEIRNSALRKQVVYAAGALQQGDVQEAITRIQRVLAQERTHEGARALLHQCGEELIRRAERAMDAHDYAEAGEHVHTVETILPGSPLAVDLHQRLVHLHSQRADAFYLEGDYVAALEEIESVRRLETDNPRTAALFEKIDEKVGFPQVMINSVLKIHDTGRVMATIDGTTAQLAEGEQFRNIRVTSIDPRSGVVVFEQVYTGEQLQLVKVPGGQGTWITSPR